MKSLITLVCSVFIFQTSLYSQSPSLGWALNFGVYGADEGHDIAIDKFGNVLTTGEFEATVDFDPGTQTHELTSHGEEDIFIQKLDPLGNYLWAVSMGTGDYQTGYAIASDNEGSVVTAGYFVGTVDFDPGIETFNLTADYGGIFIQKLNSSGEFIWAIQMDDPIGTDLISIAVDLNDNVYSSGYFTDTVDFDPGINEYKLICSGISNVFIQKLSPAGNFQWAKSFECDSYATSFSLTIDEKGNLYSTGSFSGSMDFDPGPDTFQIICSSEEDMYIQKLDSNGNFLWAKSEVASDISSESWGTAITSDSLNNVYVAGVFAGSVDADPGLGNVQIVSNGSSDVLILKLDSAGNFKWVKSIGSISVDRSYSIKLDALDNVYVTGGFKESADFNPGNDTFQLTSQGWQDIFILKLDSSGDFEWARSMGALGSDVGFALELDAMNNLYATGFFGLEVDFDPSSDSLILNAESFDVFILKWGDVATGISLDNSANYMTVFPNPTSTTIHLQLPSTPATITLFNLLSQKMKEEKVSGGDVIVDVSELPAGLYVVRTEEKMVGKFVKE
ncbi:MAG: T9SS type A sorting domain-containing protein [Chitinophagales bacterium]|nr:T9SS type A sorting domain-containing protein [Chitinophagales bacterium]